jgi:hypothetical protein
LILELLLKLHNPLKQDKLLIPEQVWNLEHLLSLGEQLKQDKHSIQKYWLKEDTLLSREQLRIVEK